jgi:hypothetical protein
MVLGASNFKNTLTIWDFRSDEVKLRQEFIPAYVKREVELKTIADILRSRNIGKYATNSWCRYLPNGIRDFKFGFYDCDNRAFEVSSIVVGTPLLGGWSYDYKYGRDDANDNFIETLIDVHKVLWEIKDVSKFWGELGVSALILERGMPMPEVDITNLTQFKGHYFTLYING